MAKCIGEHGILDDSLRAGADWPQAPAHLAALEKRGLVAHLNRC